MTITGKAGAKGMDGADTAGLTFLTLFLLIVEGVGEDELFGFGSARTGALPLSKVVAGAFAPRFVGEGNFDGDFGTGNADVDGVLTVDAVVLVVLTDLSEAAELATAACGGVA